MAEQLRIDVILKNFATKELKLLDNSLVGFTKRGLAGFNKLSKSVFSVRNAIVGLGVGLAVRGISRLFTETADAAAKIDDLSVSLGVSTEALSELEFAAKLSGSNLGNLETAFRKLQQGLGEFHVTGRGVIKDVIDKLSPAFRQLVREGAPVEEVFKQVAREMKNLSAAERVFVSKIFGKDNTILIKLLTSDIDALTKQAHRLGLTLTKEMTTAAGDFNDSLAVMGAHTQGLKQQLVLGLLPALTEFFKFLIEADTKGRPAMLRFIASMVEGTTVLSASLVTLTSQLVSVVSAIQKIDVGKELKNAFGRAAAILKGDLARLIGDEKLLAEAGAEYWKLHGETFAATFSKASEAAQKLSAEMIKLGKEGASGIRALAAELDRDPGLTATLDRITTAWEENKRAAEGASVVLERFRALRQSFASGEKRLGNLFDVEALRKYVISLGDVPGRLKIIEQAELDLAEARKAASDAAPTVEQTQAMFEATNAIAGAGRAFKDLGQASREWGVAANQAVHAVADSIADNVTDGLMDLIDGTKSAKEAFADMARGILRDIARIIIQTTILKAVQGAFGQVGFAEGGIVPGHIEPVRGHLARGGIVRNRGLFEIAEGGKAEAVIPLINGTHIPTKDVSGRGRGGGGAPTVIINSYYTANFLDAAHERQLLLRNAKLMATLVGNEIRQSPAIREAFRAA